MGQCWKTELRVDEEGTSREDVGSRRRSGCCRRLVISKRLLRIYIATFTTYFASAFVITMIFPFLPFMILHILPGLEETSVGKYAGYIAGAMFFGRFCSNYVWGAIADRKGRKPVLIISILLTGLTTLAFGFSVNFPMAVITRCLAGVANGCTATVKAVVSESSNNHNQAFGVSILTTSLTLGYILGPAVSGVIADPIQEYNITGSNSTFIDFFSLFPYSPPCIVSFFICLVAAFFLFFMPETLNKENPKYNSLKNVSESVNVIENEEESYELGQSSATGAAMSDSTETWDTNVRRDGDNSSTESSLQMKEQVPEPDASVCLNEVSESTELVETEDHCQETETQTRKKRRRSSFILAFFPGRRDSMSPLVLTVSRSQQAQMQHQFGALQPSSTRGSVVNSVETDSLELHGVDDLVSVNSSDQEQLINPNMEESALSGDDYCGFKFVAKLKKFKRSAILSLKDLKYFMIHRNTRLTVLIYAIFSFFGIGFDDVYSLWCATPAYYGGLGFSLRDIGISLSIVGACQLPFSLLCYPIMERRLGAINSFHVMAIMLIILVMLLPNLHFFVPLDQSALLWVLLCFIMLAIRVALQISFASTFIFINNSVSFDKLGSINGFAMSVTALVRTVAPVFASSLYYVSLSESTRAIGFPVDYHLIFIIFALIILATDIMVALLPKSINRQLVKDENKSSS